MRVQLHDNANWQKDAKRVCSNHQIKLGAMHQHIGCLKLRDNATWQKDAKTCLQQS